MTGRMKQLLDELLDLPCLDQKGLKALVEEIREELDKAPILWPDGVAELVAELVSPSVWNRDSRTFKTLDKEIVWVCGHWHDRHGPLNSEQREYMSLVLCQAIRKAVKDAGGDRKKLYPFLKTEIRSRLNDERVADGFKRRTTPLLNVVRQLETV